MQTADGLTSNGDSQTNSHPFVFYGVAALVLIIIVLLIMYLKR